MNATEQYRIIFQAITDVFAHHGYAVHKEIYATLAEAYGQSHRRHHGLEHIADMIAKARQVDLENPRAFLAAILYRSVIYDPSRHAPDYKGQSNEMKSAILCTNILEMHGIETSIRTRAVQLIALTEKHKAPQGDAEAALFMDIDMSILGSPLKRYKRYARETAQEFLSVFTEKDYRAGRLAFLKKIKDSTEPIFQSPRYASFETAARQNIAWEIKNIAEVTYFPSYGARKPSPP